MNLLGLLAVLLILCLAWEVAGVVGLLVALILLLAFGGGWRAR